MKPVAREVQANGLFIKLEWTLGQFAPGSQEYVSALNGLIPLDSGLRFDREHFLNVLASSMSLSITEKRRVLSELSLGLSQKQVDALISTFEEECREFERIVQSRQSEILPIYLNTIADWATICMGVGLSNLVMGKIVNSVLRDEDSLVPAVFSRNGNFWKVLGDQAILWGIDDGLINAIVSQGVAVSTQENPERSFVIDLMDLAYRTNLYSMRAPRSYIERRARIFSGYIGQLTNTKHPLLVLRAYLVGLCEDYFHLNQITPALKCVDSARGILEALKAESKSSISLGDLKKTEGLIAATELTLLPYAEEGKFNLRWAAELLKTVWKNSPQRVTSNSILITLSLMHQGDLCCNLLALKIEQNPSDVLDAAMHLLLFAHVTSNSAAISGASQVFIDHLPASLKEAAQEQKRNRSSLLVHKYVETAIFCWLGDNSAEEREQSMRLFEEVASSDFHKEVRSLKPGEKRAADFPGFKYWLVSHLEEKIRGDSGSVSELNRSIKEYWQLHHALVMLYGLSSNKSLRSHCQELAYKLMHLSERRLFGFPLGEDQMELFAPFAHKLDYAGSSPQQLSKWRGKLVYEELFA